MGADCARSYQAEPKKNYQNRTLNPQKNYKNHQGRELIINACSWITDRENSWTGNSNTTFHTQVLNSTLSSAKFIPQVGFQNVHSNGKPINHQIYFNFLHLNQNAPKIQINIPEYMEVWKKIPSFGSFLSEGNQIKMSETRMKLKYWLNSNQISKERQSSTVRLRTCQDSEAECRFCLQSAHGSQNPLVMPCKCQGSVSAVHQRCLSDWIFNYTGSFHQQVASFCFKVKHAQCEICKQSFENYIWNRMMTLLSAFNGHYAIFQVNPTKDSSIKDRQFAIFRFNQKQHTVSIGTSPICEYISPDDYMSDIHTVLHLVKGKIFMKDNQSKHGTYIATRNKYLGVNESYQIGDTYFSIRQNTPNKSRHDWD